MERVAQALLKAKLGKSYDDWWFWDDQVLRRVLDDPKWCGSSCDDLLGRALQQVGKAASFSGGNWVDMVQPIEYDEEGRTIKKYIPYPTADNPGKYKSINVLTGQAAFVTGQAIGIDGGW